MSPLSEALSALQKDLMVEEYFCIVEEGLKKIEQMHQAWSGKPATNTEFMNLVKALAKNKIDICRQINASQEKQKAAEERIKAENALRGTERYEAYTEVEWKAAFQSPKKPRSSESGTGDVSAPVSGDASSTELVPLATPVKNLNMTDPKKTPNVTRDPGLPDRSFGCPGKKGVLETLNKDTPKFVDPPAFNKSQADNVTRMTEPKGYYAPIGS